MKNKLNDIIEKYKTGPVQFKASVCFLICLSIQKGISVITTPIFTRIMTTEDYGNFNVFYSWMNIIMVIVSLNLFYEVYEQGVVKFEKTRSTFSSSMQGLELTLIFIWEIIYFVFRDFWNNIFSLTTTQMVFMFLLIWTTAVFNFWAVEQRVQYKYKRLALITVLVSIISPVLGIIFIKFSDDKVTARILSLLIVQLIFYPKLFVEQLTNGKKIFDKYFWKYAMHLNVPLIPHYLSQTVLMGADRIMIEKMDGASNAGIYSLAYSISLLMAIVNQAINQTLGPWMFKKIKERKIQELKGVVYVMLILVASINLLLIAFTPECILLFAPVSYYEAIWIIPPIAMSVYFTFAYDIFCKFEFYFEKTKYITAVTTIGALLNVILNYFCIQIWGYQAAAYTTLFCYFIYAVLHYVIMFSICKKEYSGVQPFEVKNLIAITVIFLSIGFVLLWSYSYTIIRYIIIVIIGGSIIGFLKIKKDVINLAKRNG